MKKKIVSALLAFSMLAGMLAGCGSKDEANNDTPNDVVNEDADNTATEGPVDPVTGEALEHVTLKFIFYGDEKSANTQVWDAIAEYTKDKLNCDFDIVYIPGGDYQSKLNVMAAGGEAWDMNFDSDWTGIYSMYAQDAYMALDDLLPAYAPNLYATYQENNMIDAMKNKGKIVALPWTMTMNRRGFFLWRGDLAEAAGITVDKDKLNTYEDIDALLQQLKAAYPDKYFLQEAGFYGGDYMDVDGSAGFVVKLSDDKLTVYAKEDLPEYVECMTWAEKWQSEGIIRKDVMTDGLNNNALIREGKLIARFGTHEHLYSNIAFAEEEAYWDGTEIYEESLYANRSPLSNAMCISETSENPERVLMFLDLVETDQQLYDLVHYGIEGLTYELDEETGEVVYPEGMDSSTSNYQEWGGRWALWKPEFMRPTADYSEGFWEEEANYAATKEGNMVSPLEGFSFDATGFETEYAQRTQLYGDTNKLLKYGLSGGVDAAIAKLQSDSDAAGKQELMAEFQRQIDEFLASK